MYIVECRDKKLYTGITNDLTRRLKRHNEGKGCRFTRYRYPVELVYHEQHNTKSSARRRELEIQSFARSKKLRLIGEGKKGPSAAKMLAIRSHF